MPAQAMTQQATRHARRVYVGGLPPMANEQFAVLYEVRSNTGIQRMIIINAVAKSVPQPHKVNLKTQDKTIVVQIVKVLFSNINAYEVDLGANAKHCFCRAGDLLAVVK